MRGTVYVVSPSEAAAWSAEGMAAYEAALLRHRQRFGAQVLAHYVDGRIGEHVVGELMGWEVYPVPAPGEPLPRYDVGEAQVRTRARPTWDLMIAPEDAYHLSDVYVLVVKHTRERFRMVGWYHGHGGGARCPLDRQPTAPAPWARAA